MFGLHDAWRLDGCVVEDCERWKWARKEGRGKAAEWLAPAVNAAPPQFCSESQRSQCWKGGERPHGPVRPEPIVGPSRRLCSPNVETSKCNVPGRPPPYSSHQLRFAPLPRSNIATPKLSRRQSTPCPAPLFTPGVHPWLRARPHRSNAQPAAEVPLREPSRLACYLGGRPARHTTLARGSHSQVITPFDGPALGVPAVTTPISPNT